jgi:hypothetical protein
MCGDTGFGMAARSGILDGGLNDLYVGWGAGNVAVLGIRARECG